MTSTFSETPTAELDVAVEDLTVGAKAWSARPLSERIALLKSTHASIESAAAEWAAAAIRAKGTPRGPLEGEETCAFTFLQAPAGPWNLPSPSIQIID